MGNLKDYFKRNYFLIKLLEVILDFVFIIISFFIGVQLSETLGTGNFIASFFEIFVELFSGKIYIVKTQLLYFILNLFFFSVYQSFATSKKYKETFKSTILALTMSNAVAIIFSFMFNKTFIGPTSIFFIYLSQIVIFSIYKYIFHLSIRKIYRKNVLVIGKKEEAIKLSIKFLHKNEKDKTLRYIFFEEDGLINEEILTYIDKVDNVIIAHTVNETNKNNIVTYCLSKDHKNVYLVPKLYETSIINSKIEQVDDTPVFVSRSLHLSITQRFVKRTFDLVLSIILLVLISPVMLITAIIMKLTDKGPLIYSQERVTRGSKKFKLYKFRTMIVDAEKETGPVWQMEDDPRITKVGKFLRKTRIDEIPQLINVIKGEMSLIGPRPEREIFIKEFIKDIPDFKYRINVKPGITGLAQVNGKYNSEPIDKLRFDLIYIKKYSIWFDIKILLLTIKAIFDRDSSATKGLPTLEEILKKRNLTEKEISRGLEITDNE